MKPNRLYRLPYALVLLVALLLHGCIDPEKVAVEGLTRVEVEGMSASQVRFTAEIEARNESGKTIQMKACEILVNSGQNTLLTLFLREEVALPRRYEGSIALPMTIHYSGGLLGMLALAQHANNNFESCLISGNATIQGGWARKTITFEGLTLAQVSQMLQINPTEIIQGVLKQ